MCWSFSHGEFRSIYSVSDSSISMAECKKTGLSGVRFLEVCRKLWSESFQKFKSLMVRKASKKYKRGTRGGRCGKAEGEVCTEDDITHVLPDAIICHILSFVPTTDAVRTSILSKRWRSLWTSVPVIDIDDRSVPSDNVSWGSYDDSEIKNRFLDFVDRVFSLNDVSCLRRLSLQCDYEYDYSRVKELINTVITRNVEVLELGFIYDQCAVLPPSLLTCGKLVSLKLSSLKFFDVPTPVFLPSLKILHLHCVEFHHEDSMKNLIGCCPLLEDLDVIGDFFDSMKTFFVRSCSLKVLKIDRQYCYDTEDNYSGGIVVDSTNVERLDLKCDATEQCALNDLSSLVEVKLAYSSVDLTEVHGNKAIELLRKMSNTTYMQLSYCTMQTLEVARLDNMPMFHNLTRLKVYLHRWEVLSYLLECSPNLTTFVCDTLLVSTNDQREMHKQFREPICLMLYLDEVQVISFKGGANEMKMVSYFLKNASLLKKLSIRSYTSNEETMKKLLMFPRNSAACQIAFE